MLQGTIVETRDGLEARVLSCVDNEVEAIVISPVSRRAEKIRVHTSALEVKKEAREVWTECFGKDVIDEKNLNATFEKVSKTKVKKKPRGHMSLQDQFLRAMKSGDMDEQKRILGLMGKGK